MTRDIYDPDCYYGKMFHQDEGFAPYRQFALDDPTNKNTADFTHDKLIISNHVGYVVAFDKRTDEPAVMAGLLEVQPGVGRMMNRHYIFPKYRSRSFTEVVAALNVTMELIIKPLYNITPFHTHVMTMPNRSSKPRQGFWKAFAMAHAQAWPGHWVEVDGYIQTGSNPHGRRSWQNALTDNPSWPFTTLTHEEWIKLK